MCLPSAQCSASCASTENVAIISLPPSVFIKGSQKENEREIKRKGRHNTSQSENRRNPLKNSKNGKWESSSSTINVGYISEHLAFTTGATNGLFGGNRGMPQGCFVSATHSKNMKH